MKTTRFLACAALLTGLGSAGTAQEPEPKTTTIQVTSTKLLRAGGDIVGAMLVNSKNEPMGKAEDLVIHPRGDVAFVVFSGAPAVQSGTHQYPIPWRALDRNESSQFVLATEPGNFAKMPHFAKGEPNLSAKDWWVEADAAYSKFTSAKSTPVESSASLAPAKTLYLASDLRVRSIENANGEKVATMHEIVLDPNAGRVAYAVLSVGGGGAGGDEKLIAVPWEALKSMPDKTNPKLERLTLATTREQLEKAPEFQASSEGWKAASEPAYVIGVYEFYAMPPYRIAPSVEPPKK